MDTYFEESYIVEDIVLVIIIILALGSSIRRVGERRIG